MGKVRAYTFAAGAVGFSSGGLFSGIVSGHSSTIALSMFSILVWTIIARIEFKRAMQR